MQNKVTKEIPDEATVAYYNSIARRYDLIFSYPSGYNENLCKKLDTFFRRLSIKRILDCGCGTGNTTVGLAKSYDVVGLDISEKMLEIVTEKARRQNVNAKFLRGDWRNLNTIFKRASFDCVICNGNSLFHVPSHHFALSLKNMYDVLRNGGICYVDTRRWEDILRRKPRFALRGHRKISNTDIVVFDTYDYSKNFVIFNVHFIFITYKENCQNFQHESYKVRCHYVFKDALLKSFKEAGFSRVQQIEINSKELPLDTYVGYKD